MGPTRLISLIGSIGPMSPIGPISGQEEILGRIQHSIFHIPYSISHMTYDICHMSYEIWNMITPQNVLHLLKSYEPHKSPLRTLKAESHDCEATIDLNRG